MDKNEKKINSEKDKNNSIDIIMKDKEKQDNEENDLDKLFLKTKTKPYIYFLPLTEEQVKQKIDKNE